MNLILKICVVAGLLFTINIATLTSVPFTSAATHVATPSHTVLRTSDTFELPHTSASFGCQNNPVSINADTYYRCEVLASPCLRVHGTSHGGIVGCLSYGSTIYVFCQVMRDDVNGSRIWENIYWTATNDLVFISDYYVNTANYAAYSPPIKECFFGGSL